MGFGASDPRATHTIRAFAGLPGRAGFLQAGPPSVRSLSARPANFSKAGNEASRVSSGDPNGCAQDLDAALQHQRRQKDAKPEPPAAASGSLCAGMLTPAGPVRECSVTDSQGAARVMEAERSPVEVVCVDFRMLRASCGVAEIPAPPCGCPDACHAFLVSRKKSKGKRGGGIRRPKTLASLWHLPAPPKDPLDGGIARYQATPNLSPWGLSLRQMVAGCSQLKMSHSYSGPKSKNFGDNGKRDSWVKGGF